MIRNYFRTAWRNLIRDRRFSLINISGLSIGLVSSLLIYLWVSDERSVDAFHRNGPQLFQVYERQVSDGKAEAGYFTQGLLAAELKRAIPEIDLASPLEQTAPTPYTLRVGDKALKADGSYAGRDFFRMFSFALSQGTAAAALDKPGGIAISRKIAAALFGAPAAAMGRTIRFENREDLQVVAVFEDPGAHSSLRFDFLRNWSDYARDNAWVNTWGSSSPATYILLRPGADPAAVEAKVNAFVQQMFRRQPGNRTEAGIQRFSDTYLQGQFKNGLPGGGRIEYVRLFSLVAVFILALACINFMNLSTARSSRRSKEVGIRKVMGAGRPALIGQFIGEAVLLTAFAIAAALVLAYLVLPGFNQLTGKAMNVPLRSPGLWVLLAGLLLGTGFVAGSYPALFLSALQPVRVLKDRFLPGRGAGLFRKGLVVFQFSLSIILVVGMVVVYRQLAYIKARNLGYDRENLIYIPIGGALRDRYALFHDKALALPGVAAVSEMKESPTVIGHHKGGIGWTGKDPNQAVSFADAAVGYDFVRTLGLTLKEGRDFSREFGDTTGIILNEMAAAQTGYKEPIGQPFWLEGKRGTIVGVLRDFHFNSLHQPIEPLFLRLDRHPSWGNLLVRLKAGQTAPALAALETLCRTIDPDSPFSFQFSDEQYAKLYQSEQVVGRLIDWFAVLAIAISCLGLFGLATFMAARRTREIGIRKVLGASVPGIAWRLSAHFLTPVCIAFAIACPVSYWLMQQWLQNFAYKVPLDAWIFVLAGGLTAVIALLTVMTQSIQAALRNPVKSLRAE